MSICFFSSRVSTIFLSFSSKTYIISQAVVMARWYGEADPYVGYARTTTRTNRSAARQKWGELPIQFQVQPMG